MANKAMKAARGDVLGQEVKPAKRARYTGATRGRDTQAAAHPMRGLWTSLRGMSHSCRPAARRSAAARYLANYAARYNGE